MSDHRTDRHHHRTDVAPTASMSPCVNPRCKNLDDDGNVEPVSTRFCDSCRRRVRRDLLELAELYVELHFALEPARSSGQHTSGTRELPLPLNTRNRAMMEDLFRGVTILADRIRAERTGRVLKPSETTRPSHPDTARRQRESRHLSRSITYIAGELHFALEKHSDGADTGDQIMQLNHRARSTLGLTRYIHHYKGLACPDCGLMAVGQESGTEAAQCRACGASWPAAHIKALVGIVARELAEGA